MAVHPEVRRGVVAGVVLGGIAGLLAPMVLHYFGLIGLVVVIALLAAVLGWRLVRNARRSGGPDTGARPGDDIRGSGATRR